MGFGERLMRLTGTQLQEGGIVSLIRDTVEGQPKYLNSGVSVELSYALSEGGLSYVQSKADLSQYAKIGKRLEVTHVHLPAGSVEAPPHMHPGGEIIIVEKGEYIDADMSGKPIVDYPEGRMVAYNVGSTHRPISPNGAKLWYISFDGLVPMKNRLPDFFVKMKSMGTADEAIEFALAWMVTDPEERKALTKQVLG